MDFARLIDLAVQKGGQQGIYNWPSQVRDVYKDVYGSEARAGGQYGNSFQAGLSSLLPTGNITNFMADALNLSQLEDISLGQATVRSLSNRQDSVLTNTDADLMKMKSIGDYLNGNISKDDASNIKSYVANLSRLKDTTSAASGAQTRINNLERDIQRTQEQYQNSSLGMASTKDTYEPRLASLNSRLEEARADLIVKQGRLNETTGKFNTAYNSVANLNTSMGILPASQAASVFGGATTSDFQAGQQGTINQTQAAQQAATTTTYIDPKPDIPPTTTYIDPYTGLSTGLGAGGKSGLSPPPNSLEGLSSSPPYSDETVSRVTALLNSGEVDVNQVSSHFNVPIPSIIQGLTGISRDAYTSGDDIANADVNAVIKMINSGVASIADVADYFSSDPSIIENYLTDVELYSAEDLANARQGVAVASAGVRNIAADGDYTEAEIQMVTDSINNGLLSTAQVAQQFGLSEDEVIAYMANQNTNQNNNQNNNQGNNQNTPFPEGTYGNGVVSNTVGDGFGKAVAFDGNNQGLFSGNNTAEDQARARELGMTDLQYAQAGGLGAGADQAAISAGGLNTTYNTGAEIPTGLRGSEMALQGGAAGAIASLDALNAAGRSDLSTQTAAGLASAAKQKVIAEQAIRSGTTTGLNSYNTAATAGRKSLKDNYASALAAAEAQSVIARGDITGAETRGMAELDAGLLSARNDITGEFGRAEGMFDPYAFGGKAALQKQLALSGALGQDAFNAAYQESPQMAFLREQGMRANLAGAGATGGLGGGNVQKELQRFGQGLASQGLQQQIANLGSLSNQGLNAAGSAAGIATSGGTNLANLGVSRGQAGLQSAMSSGTNLANIASGLGGQQLQTGTSLGSNLANMYTDQGQAQLGAYTGQGANLSNLATGLGAQQLQTQASLGSNLAGYNLSTGLPTASTISNVSTNLAAGRTRVGEQEAADETARALGFADIYANQSARISNDIDNQRILLMNQVNSGAITQAQAETAYGTALANAQSNIGSALAGVQQSPIVAPNYQQGIGNALQAGGYGYNMFQPHQTQNQNQNQNANFTNQQTQDFGNFYYGQPNTATLAT